MRKKDLEALGRRLRDARKDARLTQEQVGRRLSVSKQLVSHWEKAVSTISIESLRDFATFTGTSLDWLLLAQAQETKGPTANIRHGGWLVAKLNQAELIELARGHLNIEDARERKFTQIEVSAQGLWFDPVDEGMGPAFAPGNVSILVDPSVESKPGDHVAFILLASDRLLFRRYKPHDGVKPTLPPFDLVPDNPVWPTVSVTRRDSPFFLGTMIASETRYKAAQTMYGRSRGA